jgi:hypothetical protein
MDMLEVGRNLTTEEDKTHFGMWCIMNSPLLIGCDVRSINSTALALLKNQELIALNQDTLYQQAYVAKWQDSCFVMVKDIELQYGTRRAFAVYNPTDKVVKTTVRFRDIDLAGNVKLRDVFQKKDLGSFSESYEVTLPKHGTRIYVAEADTRLERVRYEAEAGYNSVYQEIKNNQSEKTGSYSADINCSGGYKAGWLGRREANDLQWRNVYSKSGGEYNLTIGFLCQQSRSITVSVNGKKVKTLSLSSGSFSKVGRKTLPIELLPGENTIRLSNASSDMPDIDYVDVEPAEGTAVGSSIIKEDGQNKFYNLSGRPADASNAHGIMVSQGRKVIR